MERINLWENIQKLRTEVPLIHNITNFVVMNTTANALLAIGASPVMAHAKEETEDITAISKALVINTGTLENYWIESMIKSGVYANSKKIPVVIDPVGAGASDFRNIKISELINKVKPSVIRGNASEIKALTDFSNKSKGVDSLLQTNQVITDAIELARKYNCVVSVSGNTDIIVKENKIAKISNGHPIMSKVTGMGCISTALTGAFLGVLDEPFDAAISAMAVMGLCGELAQKKTNGPGSFFPVFLDQLYNITQNDFNNFLKLEITTISN